jgi:hypothetical protein
MFIDCDMLFSVEDVKRLVTHNEAIVGGFYPIKEDGELRFCTNALPLNPGPDERGLFPLRYIGTAFLLVSRQVFESMLAAYGEEISYRCDLTRRVEHDFWRAGVYREARGRPGRYLGEDWYFCQRALDLGFKVYGDTQVILKHIGSIAYPAKSQEVRWDFQLNNFKIQDKMQEREAVLQVLSRAKIEEKANEK